MLRLPFSLPYIIPRNDEEIKQHERLTEEHKQEKKKQEQDLSTERVFDMIIDHLIKQLFPIWSETHQFPIGIKNKIIHFAVMFAYEFFIQTETKSPVNSSSTATKNVSNKPGYSIQTIVLSSISVRKYKTITFAYTPMDKTLGWDIELSWLDLNV